MFKPMLADPPDHEKHPLRFPLYASPKLDGIRCIITPDGPRTRALKPIPNRKLAEMLATLPVGLDGELIAGSETAPDVMQRTTSAVMGHDAPIEDVRFHVFDFVDDFDMPAMKYKERIRKYWQAWDQVAGYTNHWFRPVDQEPLYDMEDLFQYEADAVKAGYEGVMVRDPNAPYKFGRSSAREQGLLKLKRFEDAEGAVIDAYELEHNANEAETNELGRTKRSTKKAGKVPAGTLGGFVVALGPEWAARSVRVGGGWTAAERAVLWESWQKTPHLLRGQLLKYKFQRAGSKDAPRMPIFIGWRDERDMGGA